MNIVQSNEAMDNSEMDNVQARNFSRSEKADGDDELIEITKGLIAERGLRGLKVRDAATAAGCALGSIYNDYGDFDGLILEVSPTPCGT